MANIKSQIKRNRQNEVGRARNRMVRSRVRTLVKRFRTVAGEGDREAAESAYRVAARELDRAATKGVLHPNSAANQKSKMARTLTQL